MFHANRLQRRVQLNRIQQTLSTEELAEKLRKTPVHEVLDSKMIAEGVYYSIHSIYLTEARMKIEREGMRL